MKVDARTAFCLCLMLQALTFAGGTTVFECDFEDGISPPCGITQNTTGNTDWVRNSGKTDSIDTGPSVDHTLNNSIGHYFYMEASGLEPGHQVVFSTPELTGTGPYCLIFWYHMYGQHMGSIQVTQVTDTQTTVIFTRTDDQTDHWYGTRIDLPQGVTKLQFTATKGGQEEGHPYSDIAVDDISVEDTPCNDVPSTTTTTMGTTTTTRGGRVDPGPGATTTTTTVDPSGVTEAVSGEEGLPKKYYWIIAIVVILFVGGLIAILVGFYCVNKHLRKKEHQEQDMVNNNVTMTRSPITFTDMESPPSPDKPTEDIIIRNSDHERRHNVYSLLDYKRESGSLVGEPQALPPPVPAHVHNNRNGRPAGVGLHSKDNSPRRSRSPSPSRPVEDEYATVNHQQKQVNNLFSDIMSRNSARRSGEVPKTAFSDLGNHTPRRQPPDIPPRDAYHTDVSYSDMMHHGNRPVPMAMNPNNQFQSLQSGPYHEHVNPAFGEFYFTSAQPGQVQAHPHRGYPIQHSNRPKSNSFSDFHFQDNTSSTFGSHLYPHNDVYRNPMYARQQYPQLFNPRDRFEGQRVYYLPPAPTATSGQYIPPMHHSSNSRPLPPPNIPPSRKQRNQNSGYESPVNSDRQQMPEMHMNRMSRHQHEFY